ncbi:MAG: hypothetical protein KGI71_05140 [Patescibacteria group bacterium]|nr:hypothetical protein [Patescibacteria group bacterium]
MTELPDLPETSAYAIRTCNANGTSYNGYAWDLTPGAINEAPDWETKAECGNGLHGLLDGYGDYSLLSNNPDAKWLIVEVERAWCVEIGAKVKFPACKIAHVGDMATTLTLISQWQIKLLLNAALAGDVKDFARGAGSTAASSGADSTAASSGTYSKAASSGADSTAASSGVGSTAASSGVGSTAASSGVGSKAASSGKKTIAMVAGYAGCAKAGPSGCIALAYDDGKRPRIVVGYVGEGIEPDTWYRVDNGQLVRA